MSNCCHLDGRVHSVTWWSGWRGLPRLDQVDWRMVVERVADVGMAQLPNGTLAPPLGGHRRVTNQRGSIATRNSDALGMGPARRSEHLAMSYCRAAYLFLGELVPDSHFRCRL